MIELDYTEMVFKNGNAVTLSPTGFTSSKITTKLAKQIYVIMPVSCTPM